MLISRFTLAQFQNVRMCIAFPSAQVFRRSSFLTIKMHMAFVKPSCMTQPIVAVFLKLKVTCAWTAPMEFHSQAVARPQRFLAALASIHSHSQCLQGMLTLSTILCHRCACCKALLLTVKFSLHRNSLLFLAPLLVHVMAACLLLFLACWGSAKRRSMGSGPPGPGPLGRADTVSSCSRPQGSEGVTLLCH